MSQSNTGQFMSTQVHSSQLDSAKPVAATPDTAVKPAASVKPGMQHWRSLEQLAGSMSGSEADTKHLDQEFPSYDPKVVVAGKNSVTRRSMLQLMSASMALAGITLSGCRRWPKEQIVAQTTGLKGQMPGVPEFYATIYERAGVGYPLLVSAWDGRPMKVEGNNLHPSVSTFNGKVGVADIFAISTPLEMYDPDRSRNVLDLRKLIDGQGQVAASTLDAFYSEFSNALNNNSSGVAVLSEQSSSISFAAAKASFLKKYPQASWVTYEPTAGTEPTPRLLLDLSKAKTIVSIDCDMLGSHANKIAHARDWAKNRKTADKGEMSRVYLAESTLSSTGSAVDVRLPVRASRMLVILNAIGSALGVPSSIGELTESEKKFVDAASSDLKKSGSAGVVVAGEHLGQAASVLAVAINTSLKSAAATVVSCDATHNDLAALKKLADDAKSGAIKVLLIIGGNPAYNAPVDLGLIDAIKTVPTSAHIGLFADETSKLCDWHINRAHYLESWGDARAFDGTVSIQQPLILPLFGGVSPIEVLAKLTGDEILDGQLLVRRALSQQIPNDAAWQTALHDGFINDTAYKSATVDVQLKLDVPAIGIGTEIRFVPSQSLFDGRYANNGWLQELPDSLTKLVWDNAAMMSKADADEKGLKTGDLIAIETNGFKLSQIPVFVLWGQPRGSITLILGYGRTASGRVGTGVGFNVNTIRTSGQPHIAYGSFTALGSSYALVSTQDYQQADWVAAGIEKVRIGDKGKQGRIVREASLVEYKKDPKFVDTAIHRLPLQQLFDAPYKKPPAHPDAPTAFNYPHAWGMSIDMNSCIGCSACVIACQSENNIPIVGKDMVAMNREMHWIRLDRYFKTVTNEKGYADDFENVEMIYMPVACVHCENAPCEQVCPVAATVHDTEGLNTMVYNRCIGTRYCANNCPYKVRRFNYFDWQSRDPRGGFFNAIWFKLPDQQQIESVDKVKALGFNPDVSVRMRGVMEKCTYCTQRIKRSTIQRKNEFSKGQRAGYVVDDFDVVTACMNACPTQAITFGNLNDKESAVLKEHKNKRAYALLEELNTRPRTMYLAKIRNPLEEA